MENLEALYLLLLTGGVPTLFTVGITISLSSHYEKKQERKEIERKKQRALEAIVHEDISADSVKKDNLKERILEHYEKDEVTPELISYFKDNYLSVLESETQKIAEQKALDEKIESELNSGIQDLEKSQKAQLDAFKSVKELNQQATGAQ